MWRSFDGERVLLGSKHKKKRDNHHFDLNDSFKKGEALVYK